MALPAKKKPPAIDLAILMGGEGSKKPPMGDTEPDGDDMPEMGAEESESDGAFDLAFEEFNDASLPPEDRKAAFKRAVMACMEGDY